MVVTWSIVAFLLSVRCQIRCDFTFDCGAHMQSGQLDMTVFQRSVYISTECMYFNGVYFKGVYKNISEQMVAEAEMTPA